MGYLFVDSLYWLVVAPFKRSGTDAVPKRIIRRDDVFFQMMRLGFRAVPIVFLVSLFVGIVLALQLAYILRQFGVVEYTASVVCVAIFRELGPLLTAILMAGFAGASIAAELGTMAVSEELMALRTSAINPVRFLVVPRLLASMIMIPCLTMIANVVGVLGGALVGFFLLHIDPTLYYDKTIHFLQLRDLNTGLLKSVGFAIIVVILASYEGLNVSGGAEDVGRATTSTVVFTIIAIIAFDVVFTTIFYYVT